MELTEQITILKTTSLAHNSRSLFLSLLNLVLKYSIILREKKPEPIIQNIHISEIQNLEIESEIPRQKSKKFLESYFFVLKISIVQNFNNSSKHADKISDCKSTISTSRTISKDQKASRFLKGGKRTGSKQNFLRPSIFPTPLPAIPISEWPRIARFIESVSRARAVGYIFTVGWK